MNDETAQPDKVTGIHNFSSAASQNAETAKEVLEDLVTQLRTANENLVLATIEAQTMQEKAEAAHQRQNEFLAMLAHELRNPLAPISNATAALQRITSADPRLTEIHGVLSRQIEHMGRLLDDLLDASRVSSGKIALQKQPALLAEVIERAVEVSRPFIDKRKQRLSVELQEEPVLIDGDLVRLAQVFSNLLMGHSVGSAFDGNTGLEMARANAYEVIVCDVGLPGMDGLQLVGHLRGHLRRQTGQATPLMIATSGYGQPEDRKRAIDAGFDEYLVKPVESALLLRLIASHASGVRAAAPGRE